MYLAGMKVSGFTFIKDAITYDYPILEAIKSILPICDEFVVAVGASSDETLALIQGIDSEQRFFYGSVDVSDEVIELTVVLVVHVSIAPSAPVL